MEESRQRGIHQQDSAAVEYFLVDFSLRYRAAQSKIPRGTECRPLWPKPEEFHDRHWHHCADQFIHLASAKNDRFHRVHSREEGKSHSPPDGQSTCGVFSRFL